MPTDDHGSETRWLGDLKAGDQAAAQPLWVRYFASFVRLARPHLRVGYRSGADAAHNAFDSVCRGAEQGRFTQLADRTDLWRLLVVLTVRKAVDQARRRRLQRRGGRVLGETDLAGADPDAGPIGLDQIVGREPIPKFAAMVAEEQRRRIDALKEEALRRVALGEMAEFTSERIAGRLGCTRRIVTRYLDLIPKRWLAEGS
ncbi:MAG: ECF-type sigma factor [Singulisphaera sp.]